jgi:pimeloyl-ACP methyl ester carboxylesterase
VKAGADVVVDIASQTTFSSRRLRFAFSALLDALSTDHPLLVAHSDGGTIALFCTPPP